MNRTNNVPNVLPRVSELDDTARRPHSAGLLLNDLYRLNGETLQWTKIGPAAAVAGTWPEARWGHGIAWAAGRLYIFGGWGGGGALQRSLPPDT